MRKLTTNNKGITLIEIIISLGILALIIVPTITVFTASVRNNKASQNLIENKYLAESYIEIVKGAEISAIPAVLASYGFEQDADNAGVFTNIHEGVTVSVQPDGIVTSGDSGTGYKVKNIIGRGAECAIYAADEGTDKITLYFDGSVNKTVLVTNTTGSDFTIYCVNINPSDGSIRDSTMPTFRILEGKVAFKDYTVSGETSGEPLVLSYSIDVSIDNEKGQFALGGLRVIQ